MRPLTRISSTARWWAAVRRFGQSSDSISSPRSGRQWSRNRPTSVGRSIGMYWWITPSGRRSASSLAEVTVPVVTSRLSPGQASRTRPISGRAESDSPTLAP
jgi:hypothetical protein